MKLKLVCPENFKNADQIAGKIEDYLPSLIKSATIIRTNVFNIVSEAKELENKLEQKVKPNWNRDLVINIVEGLVIYQGNNIYTHAVSLSHFTDRPLPALFKIRNLRKGGHIILGNLVEDKLKEDIDYLANLGLEQFHKMLGILPHNKNCFTFYSKSGIIPDEVIEKDYCPQCREFMARLSDPLDYKQISELKREIYPNARKRYWEFVRLKNKSDSSRY